MIRKQSHILSHIYNRFKKANITTATDRETVQELEKNVMKRKAQLYEIEQTLPQKNSLYLQIILGNVNVSILNRNDKVRYKDDYEKFKLILNGIALVLAIINLIFNSRYVFGGDDDIESMCCLSAY